MPFISTKTNVSITPGKETTLKEKLGQAIAIIPGKSEGNLMLSFEEACQMYYKGDNEESLGYVDVKLFGAAEKEDLEKFVAEVAKAYKEVLGIEPENLYVSFTETEKWSWNGAML
ncbi:MAG: tautomerase family protein [Clostridiales bacterium]|jgi:phenylpyruvate tautomerase PptA (4-oxalocrotonate tautomerase family)|nr:tautomerase family protein [Clostridiales bacterium]MDR2749526.1 tautomerase family protein [Clostridiales bacterium]